MMKIRIPKIFVYLSLMATGIFFGCAEEEEPNRVLAQASLSRVANITDTTYSIGSEVAGTATVESLERGVRLNILVQGLTPNSRHAVHIHLGSCEAPGAHWNQASEESFCEAMSLGVTWARPKAGDVGNVNTDAQGNGALTIETDLWSVGSGDEKDIMGAVIIVHERGEEFLDHCFSNHTHVHDANAKIACGMIEGQL